jgi:hypothetical protein
VFCPMCGASSEDDSIFCGNCGAVLKPDEPPTEVVEKASAAQGTEAELDDVVAEPSPLPPPRPASSPSIARIPPVPTSGMAIASLVLGIGGLTILPLLGSIVAIILGYMARNDIRQRPDQVSGDGLAVAGIVLGWISIGLAVLGLLAFGGLTACGICGALGLGSS